MTDKEYRDKKRGIAVLGHAIKNIERLRAKTQREIDAHLALKRGKRKAKAASA